MKNQITINSGELGFDIEQLIISFIVSSGYEIENYFDFSVYDFNEALNNIKFLESWKKEYYRCNNSYNFEETVIKLKEFITSVNNNDFLILIER